MCNTVYRVAICVLNLFFTFPEAFDPLVPGYGPVSFQGAVVPLHCAPVWHSDLSLEPDFDHVGGLGKGNGHGSSCAARQQPGPDAHICRQGNGDTWVQTEDAGCRVSVMVVGWGDEEGVRGKGGPLRDLLGLKWRIMFTETGIWTPP